MRTLIFILFLGISVNGLSQEWNLVEVDLFSAYSYCYEYRPAKDSSYCSDFTTTKQDTLKVSMLDYADEAIPFANLVLKNEMGQTVSQAMSDIEGECEIPLQPGTYTLYISSLGYSTFQQEFVITGKGADITIHLGRSQLMLYSIQSKRVLTGKDKANIGACLQLNTLNECSDIITNEIIIGIQL